MNLNIQGHHVDLSDALRSHLSEKIEKLSRHMDGLINLDVILTVDNKINHKAEANLQVSGATLHAESTRDDMYAAIDGMVDKLDKQVCKFNAKRHDHHANEAHKTGLSMQ